VPPLPGDGGETPIARNRDWHLALGDDVIAAIEARGLMGRVNDPSVPPDADGVFHGGWQGKYFTTDRSAVEAACRRLGYEFRWEPDGSFSSWTTCRTTLPYRGRSLWFCTPQFCRPASDTEYCYADGEPIEPALMERIHAAQWRIAVTFAWQAGDVLCLDNITCQHGRLSFTEGCKRRILAALTA
jgi:hypothetical protein